MWMYTMWIHLLYIHVVLQTLCICVNDCKCNMCIPVCCSLLQFGWSSDRVNCQECRSNPRYPGSSFCLWGFHTWGYPNSWMVMENSKKRWMIWGYFHFRRPLYNYIYIYYIIYTYIFIIYIYYILYILCSSSNYGHGHGTVVSLLEKWPHHRGMSGLPCGFRFVAICWTPSAWFALAWVVPHWKQLWMLGGIQLKPDVHPRVSGACKSCWFLALSMFGIQIGSWYIVTLW